MCLWGPPSFLPLCRFERCVCRPGGRVGAPGCAAATSASDISLSGSAEGAEEEEGAGGPGEGQKEEDCERPVQQVGAAMSLLIVESLKKLLDLLYSAVTIC